LRPHEAVVAGSPEFVDALLPLVTERLGGAPRVADSPHLASALCQDGARLLVYEHCGREWLSLCGELRSAAGPELIVVAALRPEHAADVAEISAAASAVVAWRGDARPVLEAVGRVVAAREAPKTAAPVRRPGPVLTPQPTPVVVRPSPTPPPPSATPRPRPVMATQPGQTVRPAVAAVKAAPTPAPKRPSADLAEESAFDTIFDEESGDEGPGGAVAGGVATPGPAAEAPPSVTSTVWPGTVLSADDGLAVVRAALSGLWPEQRLRRVTEKVVAALSTAEKAAAQGHKLPFDPAPVRQAVGLRWQVAAAIDALPPVGAPIDQGAVQAILGGIDDVLSALKEQSDDAGPEALRAIETVRHTLVKEAIDLTEALQQVAPPEMVEEITTSRKARRTGAAPVTRMVTNTSQADAGPSQVPWGFVVLLVLVLVAAAAYHGYGYVNRARPAASTIAGAPSGTVGTVTPRGKVVVAPAGVTLNPVEVENFKNLEKAKGNEVREISPGTFIVSPKRAPSDAAAGPGTATPQGAKQ
jgi:hypothetical protein